MENSIYQLGKIYKIVCNVTGLCYIGSTKQRLLCQRLSQHRGSYKSWKKTNKHFMTSFKVIENDNYEIVLMEEYPCETKDQLHSRERYWIEQTDCVNKCIPTRAHLESSKAYNLAHKKEYYIYQKKWRDENKEYNKKWRDENKEHLAEYDKKRYQDNKENEKLNRHNDLETS